MARDQVRTQVLLLHSEQSTLDSLSAGFDDRYTVHCATSGTEALNTLGDTPIHVIVSARNLPGMSGIEALREAKKRSPETIGILLVGDSDQGLEALVGEKEVFQVVRGGVRPDELTRLVDNATRQMRLLALAESANDTAANPDEPAEHIVMETSANGSSIITEATGTVPVLDPKKVASVVAAGSSKVDVLVLTKDEEFLNTIRESTRGMHHVHYANTLAQAEAALAGGKVGVAVDDAAMVGENVEKLTQHLRRKTGRLVNIVDGRRDDGEMLMDLINRGKVYRFLLKPVSPGRARLAIEASVKHHLEAPETAFKAGGAAPGSRPAAGARPAPRRKTAASPAQPPAQPPADAGADAPNAASLGSAFESADASFTETMTGIVSNLGKAITRRKDKAAKPPEAVPPAHKAPAGRKGPTQAETPDVEPAGGRPPRAAGVDQKPVDPKRVDQKRVDPRAEPGRVEPTFGRAKGASPGAAGTVNSPMAGMANLDADGGSSLIANPKVLVSLAATIAVIAAVGFFVFGGSDDPERRPARAADADASGSRGVVTEAAPGRGADVGALLDEARLARQAGQIFNPPGGNAIELYAEALAAAPADAAIAAELQAVLDEALRMAESAMLERRAGEAAAALDRIAFADPGNGRLPFLFAQLAQMQFREHLDNGRAALREFRFEDVANAISAARALDVPDTTEIDALAEELVAARSEQQVDDVLARAAASLDAGRLLAPANDNARYYYELVLSNDPENLLAQQGLEAVASKLVLQARTEIDAGRFDAAADLLADAERLDPTGEELADASAALSAAQERVAAAARQREAERQADELAAEQAEQRRLANERAAAERRAALTADAATASPADAATATTADAAMASSEAGETGAVEVAADNATNAGAQGDTGTSPTAEAAPESQALLAISELTRVKYVAPKYPRAAERRNLSGWVDVVFTVQADGTTGDVEVRGSEPGDMFVSAALRAVEKWEFEPVVENGRVVERQAGVRMMFALE